VSSHDDVLLCAFVLISRRVEEKRCRLVCLTTRTSGAPPGVPCPYKM